MFDESIVFLELRQNVRVSDLPQCADYVISSKCRDNRRSPK
jgi:hypothetical protein